MTRPNLGFKTSSIAMSLKKLKITSNLFESNLSNVEVKEWNSKSNYTKFKKEKIKFIELHII